MPRRGTKRSRRWPKGSSPRSVGGAVRRARRRIAVRRGRLHRAEVRARGARRRTTSTTASKAGWTRTRCCRRELTYDDVLGADLVVLVGLDAREELPIAVPAPADRRDEAAACGSRRCTSATSRCPSTDQGEGMHCVRCPVAKAAAADEMADDARALRERPVIILGPRMQRRGDDPRVARGRRRDRRASWQWAPRRSGTYGALAAGAHPDLLPAGTKPRRQTPSSVAVGDGLAQRDPRTPPPNGELKALVARRCRHPRRRRRIRRSARRALEATPFVVVQDVQSTQLLNLADLVLPAAAFVERSGHDHRLGRTPAAGQRRGRSAGCRARRLRDPRRDRALPRQADRLPHARTTSETELDAAARVEPVPVRGEASQRIRPRQTPRTATSVCSPTACCTTTGSRVSRSEGIAKLTRRRSPRSTPTDAAALRHRRRPAGHGDQRPRIDLGRRAASRMRSVPVSCSSRGTRPGLDRADAHARSATRAQS